MLTWIITNGRICKMNHKKGFTLIEMIIVIAIIAVLLAILVPTINGYLENSRKITCNTNRKSVKDYCESYRTLYHNELTLSEVFELPEVKSEISKYTCPNNGTFYVKDNNILCTIHDNGDSEGEGTVKDPAWNQNYPYESDSQYTGETKYSYGDIVEYNGVLYQCLSPDNSGKYAPGQYSVDSLNTWQVVGTSDQSAVNYTLGHHYAVGTIVKDSSGNYYMFTPPYNDSRNYSNYQLSSSQVWTKIDESSTIKKPEMISNIPSNVSNYQNNTTYSKGDYCVSNGILYQYTGSTSSKTGINYNSVNNATWTQVSKTFIYANAKYKAGDTVWYQGKYYTAKTSFTTYSGFGVPSKDSNYWTLSD